MGIIKNIKELIRDVDLFPQVPAYRYNQQPDYKTVTGGFISLLTIIFMISIFANTLLNTLNKTDVSFTISRFAQQSPAYYATTLDKSFLFAVGLVNLDLNSGSRYFDITMQSRNYTTGSKNIRENIPLTQCQRSNWEARGYGSKYDELGLEKWLCPPQNIQLILQGKYTSQIFKFYKITVAKCQSSTDPTRPCINNQVIDSYLNANDLFSLNYYYINTILNPGDSNEDYLQEYLEDVNYFSFTPTSGINANLFISSYTIDTDESLWPVSSIRSDKGGIVLDPAQTSIYQVRTGSEYMKLYLRKSPITVSISRSFKKIDETLSYIGGLFSFLLVFLFFVNKYNEYSFDIELTRHSYFFDKNEPFDGNFLNFLRFFPYCLYRILDKFNYNPNWPAYAKLHEFIESGRKHLDIRLITKKILLVQKIGLAILGKNQFQALMLVEPYTLEEAQQIRQSMKFYKRFIKKFPKKSDVQNDPLIATVNFIMSGRHLVSEGAISSMTSIPNDMVRDNQNLSRPRYFEELGLTKYRQIHHKELFNNQLSMVKRILDELQTNMAKGDKVATRIWNELDERIKNTYNLLSKKEIPSLFTMKSLESMLNL